MQFSNSFRLYLMGFNKAYLLKRCRELNVPFIEKHNTLVTKPNTCLYVYAPSKHIPLIYISSNDESLLREIAQEMVSEGFFYDDYPNYRLIQCIQEKAERPVYEVIDGQEIPTEEEVKRILGENIVKTEKFAEYKWSEKRVKKFNDLYDLILYMFKA